MANNYVKEHAGRVSAEKATAIYELIETSMAAGKPLPRIKSLKNMSVEQLQKAELTVGKVVRANVNYNGEASPYDVFGTIDPDDNETLSLIVGHELDPRYIRTLKDALRV